MTVFSDKLERLPETIALSALRWPNSLTEALRHGRGRVVVGVGSGGSAVAAEYLARCRTTLGLGFTTVMTPMQFVLSEEEWENCDIWLFSAGASNPDTVAAFRRAASCRAERVHLVTVRPDGRIVSTAEEHPRARVHLLPVADSKDGFLSTHSLTAMVAALLLAGEEIIEKPALSKLIAAFNEEAASALRHGSVPAASMAEFRPGDTIVVLHDPRLSTVGVLLETSLWETGIAPVQRTDFRNFAHGRHVWAARYPSAMFVLALTCPESVEVWAPVKAAFPDGIRTAEVRFGNAGRLRNAIGILEGMSMIGALGDVAGIDPGRPGRGKFAEAIYDDEALNLLARGLTASVRQKSAAQMLHGPLGTREISVTDSGRERLLSMTQTRFAGVVLDYDGTIVSTDSRLEVPDGELLAELVRLVDAGVQVGIATGRGGSAGEMLRSSLPSRTHPRIVIGYYNGAHLRTLETDIDHDRPQQDASLLEVAAWIDKWAVLEEGRVMQRRPVQLTLNHSDVSDPDVFAGIVAKCPAVLEGRVRMLSSHHSYDIVPESTSKLSVVVALAERAGRSDAPILRIGDSGSPAGNDNDLLGSPHGVSVDSVCGDLAGCWSVFGSALVGPAALLRILRAMTVENGGFRIDIGMLGVDSDG